MAPRRSGPMTGRLKPCLDRGKGVGPKEFKRGPKKISKEKGASNSPCLEESTQRRDGRNLEESDRN